jgi:autotransporter-associated beta strand protein
LKFGQSPPLGTDNYNDFADGTPFAGVVFSGDSSFTLDGHRIALTGSVANNSTQPQTIAFDMQLAGYGLTFNAATDELIIDGQLSGNQGLTKMGTERLVLKNSNTYTGTTIIGQGILALDGGDLPDNSTVTIFGNATLEILSGTPTFGTIDGQGTVSVSGPGTVLTVHSLLADTLNISSSSVVAAVPEPSTMLLLFIGASGLISYRRRGRG